MKDKKNIANEYVNLNLNKKLEICHSIDIDRYRILYKDFFDDNQNTNLELMIANANFDLTNESEFLFLNWLKME